MRSSDGIQNVPSLSWILMRHVSDINVLLTRCLTGIVLLHAAAHMHSALMFPNGSRAPMYTDCNGVLSITLNWVFEWMHSNLKLHVSRVKLLRMKSMYLETDFEVLQLHSGLNCMKHLSLHTRGAQISGKDSTSDHSHPSNEWEVAMDGTQSTRSKVSREF